MSNFSSKSLAVLGAVTLALTASASLAASIGVNFTGNQTSGVLAASDSAGVVPQTNWQNVVSDPTNLVLSDSSVAATSALLSAPAPLFTPSPGSANINAASTSTPAGGDEILFKGAKGQSSFALTVTGVPYTNYDVFVYLTNANDASGKKVGGVLSAGTSLPSAATFDTDDVWANTPNPNSVGRVDGDILTPFIYIQGLGTSSGTATTGANYVRYSGLTSASFNYAASVNSPAGGFGPNFGIAGFQIINNIPEPTSVGLLGVGVLGILLSRRRT